MGWRPRKSFRLGKGFRINLSKRGIGWGAGIPGLFSFGVGGDGRKRAGVGGGLTRVEKQWGGKRRAKGEKGGCCGCLVLIVLAFLGLGVFSTLYQPEDVGAPDSTSGADNSQAEPSTENNKTESGPGE